MAARIHGDGPQMTVIEPFLKGRAARNVFAGIQLILLGIAQPFGFHFLSVMSFFQRSVDN
jgi:hypothetical protein